MNFARKLLLLTAVSSLLFGCGGGGGGGGGGTSCGTLSSASCFQNDNFPTSNAIPSGWVESADSSATWELTTAVKYEGDGSLASGSISDDQASSIEYRANFSAGTISFQYKVSSEASYDFFNFYIDGVKVRSESGEVDWTLFSTTITAGTHLLKWEFSKDYTALGGDDKVWIDDLSLPSVTGPAVNSWNEKAPLPEARNAHSASVVGSNIYVFGGNNSTTNFSRVDIYDTAADSWSSSLSSASEFRRLHTSSAIGDNIYVIGGSDNASPINVSDTVDVFNTSTESWTTAASLPTAIYGAANAVVNGKIYVIGGINSTDTTVASVYEYDPAGNSWSQKTSMNTARESAAAVVMDNKIYVMGGYGSAGTALSTAEEYDPVANSWTPIASMSAARGLAHAGVIGNKIFAVGGHNSSGFLGAMEVYDASANSWIASDAMSVARSAAASTVVNNRLYVIGGWNGVYTQDVVEEYVLDSVASLTAPTTLAAYAGNSEAALLWDEVSVASSYNLYFAEESGVTKDNYATLAGGTKVSGVTSVYTQAALTNGMLYYFVVTAVNAEGIESDSSDEASVTPDAAALGYDDFPLAGTYPAGFVQAAGSAADWTVDSTDTNGSAYSFRSGMISDSQTSAVELTQSFTGPYISFAYKISSESGWDYFRFYIDGVEQLSDSGLGSWTTVSFPVSAGSHTLKWEYSKDYIDSLGSDAVWIDDFKEVSPSAAIPQNVQAIVGDGQVTVSWDAATNATNYNVSYGDTSGSYNLGTFNTSTTSQVITGLTNGEPYYLVVTAVDAYSLESGNSAEVTATPEAPSVAPATPTGFTLTPGTGNVLVSWNAVTGADSYNVYYGSVSATYGAPENTTNTTLSVSSLNNGTPYYFAVAAVNTVGESSLTSELSATPLALPSIPTGVTATPGDTAVSVNWSTAVGADTVTLRYSTTSDCSSNCTTVTGLNTTGPHNVTGLPNDTLHYFFLNGVNTVGAGSSSAAVSATPIALPAQVQNVQAALNDRQIELSWDAVTGADTYTVYYGPLSTISPTDPTAIAIPNVATTSRTITNLANGTTYYITVTANNTAGESASGSTAISAIPDVQAPVNVTVSAGDSGVILNWSSVFNAASYNVYMSTTSGSYTAAEQTGITGTTATISTLTNGTPHYFVVTAVNNVAPVPDESAVSSEVTATPVLQAPQNLRATALNGQVRFDWTAMSGVTNYSLYYSTTPGVTSLTGTLWTTIAGSASTYTGSFTNDTTYYFVMVTNGTSGASVDSFEVTATPRLAAGGGTIANPYNTYRYASAMLNNDIYLFGGTSGATTGLKYTPATNTWAATATIPNNVYYDAASAVGDKVYVFAGYYSPYVVMEYDTVANSWTTKSATYEYRYYSSSATINGKIYVIGGYVSGAPSASVMMYDPAADSFTAKASLPTTIYRHEVEVVNGKIYVVGGSRGDSSTSVYVYDPATDQWTAKADAPVTILYPASGVLDGKIVVLNSTATTYLYDYTLDSWSTVSNGYSVTSDTDGFVVNNVLYAPSSTNVRAYTSPIVTRYWEAAPALVAGTFNAAAVAVDGAIYNFGGHSASAATAWVDSFDLATQTWTAKTDMPTARTLLTATKVNGTVYAIGGHDGVSTTLATNEMYDVANDNWTTKASLPAGRLGHCTVKWTNTTTGVDYIYVIGGSVVGTGASNSVEIYNTQTNIWSTGVGMNPGGTATPRYNHACVEYNGKIYVSGGQDETSAMQSTVMVYDPLTFTWTLKTAMSQPRMYHSMVVLDGKLLVTGGDNSAFTPLATSEIYDVTANTWVTQALDSMATARTRHSATVIDNDLYVIGGADASLNPISSVEVFK